MVAKENPFRYRGYLIDDEMGIYYLNTRFYFPDISRFINMDVLAKRDMFSYCHNNPVLYRDFNGKETQNGDRIQDILDDIIDTVFYDIDEKIAKSECPELYEQEYRQTLELLLQIHETVSYNEQSGLLRIPNNTPAAETLFSMADTPRSEFFSDYDWAEMMAYVGISKYESETSRRYHTELSKVTYEVRAHAQLYLAGIASNHTDITDISTYEGKGKWIFHPQYWIDLFYKWGAR